MHTFLKRSLPCKLSALLLPAFQTPGARKLIDKLERVQKLAARIILGAPRTTRTDELYKTLNWSTLEQRRKYHIAIHVLKGLSPPYLQNTFELSEHKTSRCLRNSHRIYIPISSYKLQCKRILPEDDPEQFPPPKRGHK